MISDFLNFSHPSELIGSCGSLCLIHYAAQNTKQIKKIISLSHDRYSKPA
ncbi:Uncharacterized protein dnm_006250 [Desulfonema magnum]|uniref:Uncharacterized protein n=1 Tax=Desulfonema magnum TaxID=45655 RepID=A0A975GKE5_9BACT|nr:Uncharacterized protein dnm_006250 [Desulfonema magnum]